MLSDEARTSIGMLIYVAIVEQDPCNAIERAVDFVVRDPLSEVTPEQLLEYIREALNSSVKLNEIGPRTPHSDAALRTYLAKLAKIIETGNVKPIVEIDPDARFDPDLKTQLQVLLAPLATTANPKDAIEKVVREVIESWNTSKEFRDTIQLIRFALRSKVALAGLVCSPYSEREVRLYLRNLVSRIRSCLAVKIEKT